MVDWAVMFGYIDCQDFNDRINVPLVYKKCVLTSPNMPLSRPQCLKCHQMLLSVWVWKRVLYPTNVTSPLFNHTHSSFNNAAYTLCPQRKDELCYTGEWPLPKHLCKVNKNKRAICILINHTSLATRIHREHYNDTDLHVLMRSKPITMLEILHSWAFFCCSFKRLTYIQHGWENIVPIRK